MDPPQQASSGITSKSFSRDFSKPPFAGAGYLGDKDVSDVASGVQNISVEDEEEELEEMEFLREQLKPGMRHVRSYDIPHVKGQTIKKFEASEPYNLFLTAIVQTPETHSDLLSVTMQDLLDPSLGELESSVQINFMVDCEWLMRHYKLAGVSDKPLLILYGYKDPDFLKISALEGTNGTAVEVPMGEIGCHHSKVTLLFYTDKSMRVVVSTANLDEGDWNDRSQSLWISPKCPEVTDDHSGESVTGFREDLIEYLNVYNIPELSPSIERIRRTDFSAVKVFLVCSVPGEYEIPADNPEAKMKWGHMRIADLLEEHSYPIHPSVPVLVQASSIGMMGKNGAWALDVMTSLSCHSGPRTNNRQGPPPFKLIYPSLKDVLGAMHGIFSGFYPYSMEVHSWQRWLESNSCLWRANHTNRTNAMPHSKSYCRCSPEHGLYWYCHTSANFSRGALGSCPYGKDANRFLKMNNYEVGVLFLPKYVINRRSFPLLPQHGPHPIFPIIYDLPLVPYGRHDRMFLLEMGEIFYEKMDEVEDDQLSEFVIKHHATMLGTKNPGVIAKFYDVNAYMKKQQAIKEEKEREKKANLDQEDSPTPTKSLDEGNDQEQK